MSILHNEEIYVVNEDNIRVDRYIRRIYPHIKQSLIEQYIRKKLITVNDQKTASNARLKCDQTLKIKQLTICVENKKQSIIKPNLEKLIAKVRNLIIYEDQNIVAINKPAGLAVQGGTKVLLSIDDVLAYIKPGEILKIVHRLDKDTSGVLLFARNAMVANALMNEFKDHKIKKEYFAITEKSPVESMGIINKPIVRKVINGEELMVIDHANGKDAITHFEVIKKFQNETSLLRIAPKTGRKHQIRVHLKSIGCPILGDKKYGGKRTKLHLHAHKITFSIFKEKEVSIVAPMPDFMNI